MQTHWLTPAMYRMTNRRKAASSPPANTNRYCAFSPLNSTGRPMPLFTGYSAIVLSYSVYRKNERRMVALTIRKIQAPNQLAAVLLVSGSPDENLP